MPDQVELRAAPATGDWTVRAADTVDNVVGIVRDKAVAPVTTITRWVVFGLLAAIVGLAVLVLLSIMLVRLGVVYLPFDPPARRVWITEAALGGIFCLGGLFLWRKRKPRTS
jgi:hypothetical protein